jgi:hypothetical protein
MHRTTSRQEYNAEGNSKTGRRPDAKLGANFQLNDPLLLDDSAGDAVAGIPGGVGHEVIAFSVDDKRRPAIMKERIGPVAECDASDRESRIALSFIIHGQILQITEMWMRVLCVMDAVVGTGRVEVAAGGSKRRPFAFADIVDVNAMLTGTQL